MMDFLDDWLFGPLDLIDKAIILINMVRYWRFDTAKITIDRLDKNPNAQQGLREIVKHLRGHGIRIFGYEFDAKHFYVTIAERQKRWAKYLLNGSLHSNTTKGVKRRWK